MLFPTTQPNPIEKYIVSFQFCSANMYVILKISFLNILIFFGMKKLQIWRHNFLTASMCNTVFFVPTTSFLSVSHTQDKSCNPKHPQHNHKLLCDTTAKNGKNKNKTAPEFYKLLKEKITGGLVSLSSKTVSCRQKLNLRYSHSWKIKGESARGVVRHYSTLDQTESLTKPCDLKTSTY